MDQTATLVVNNGGAKGVREAEMDQNAKVVLNNGGVELVKTPNSCLTIRVIMVERFRVEGLGLRV